MQQARRLDPSLSPVHAFGAELRAWRLESQMSQDQLGRVLFVSGALIGKIEKAERRADQDLTERADRVLGAGGRLVAAWEAILTPTLATDASQLWIADAASDADLLTASWSGQLAHQVETLLGSHAGRVAPLPMDVPLPQLEGLWFMADSFSKADHRLGGGFARTALTRFIVDTAMPMLNSNHDDATGRQVLAAIARLCDLNGFMAFDSGAQGLAQRYYQLALRLARSAGNDALIGHICADMAMQAVHLGKPGHALNLAEIGQAAAVRAGSAATKARCLAMETRAHARAQDRPAMANAMHRAEIAQDTIDPDLEPPWLQFFTSRQLLTEFAYAHAELGDAPGVRRFLALSPHGQMRRRAVLAGATFAHSLISAPSHLDNDLEAASRVLIGIADGMETVTSTRSQDLVRRVLAKLIRHQGIPDVDEALDTFRNFQPPADRTT